MVFLLLVGGGNPYTVTAKFENASQLVNGNTVNVAGVAAGKVKEIRLADDGQALVEIEVSDEYAPLPRGTHATVRSQSLSGIANRYVDLALPPAGTEEEMIDDGGQIDQTDTTSEVDLDALFSSLDEPTIGNLKKVIKGFSQSYDQVGPQANSGFYYLSPFLSTSRRVFGELNSDQQALESLIVDTDSLTEALASRSPDIEQLVGNLNLMMGAIGRRETELASAIGQLPDFMRQFNTTAVNLRAALDDVDPLITASRPVARKLRPFARNLRGFARDSVPTIKALDGIVKRKGKANDLIELTALQVPLAEIGVGPVNRNGASRSGALPAATQALNDGQDELEFFRPYITEDAISGWFDDFSHSGFPDAIGGVGRISTTFNAFSLGVLPSGVPVPLVNILNRLTPAQLEGALDTKNLRRCPGANVQGSVLTPAEQSQLNYGGAARLRSLASPARSPGADRAMRRLAFIVLLPALALAAGWVTSAGAEDKRTYQAELFNAFGLVEGSELRVAGVTAGTVTSLDITPEKTALLTFEVGPDFPELKADASCSSEPQSLIAEYFLDCQPGSADEPLEEPIPAASNQTTVQNDLVKNTLREPFKRRFQLILNEFGTALVGNGENLNAAIRVGRSRAPRVPQGAEDPRAPEPDHRGPERELRHGLRPADRAARGRRPVHRRGRGHRAGLGRAPRGPLARLRPAGRLPVRVAPGDERARQPRPRADPLAGRPERRLGRTQHPRQEPARVQQRHQGVAQLARPRV